MRAPWAMRAKSGILVGVEPYPTGFVRLQVEKSLEAGGAVFDGIIGLVTPEEAEAMGHAILAAAADARRPK